VKKSGRDETILVVIHICMETIQIISLYSHSSPKPAKNVMFLLLSFMFFLQQDQRTRGQNRVCLKVSKIMYSRVSKHKNDKMKFKKNQMVLCAIYLLGVFHHSGFYGSFP
jgi:hypothetical protein